MTKLPNDKGCDFEDPFPDWTDFLLQKKEELTSLRKLNYKGFISIRVDSREENSCDLDIAFLSAVLECQLELTVWFAQSRRPSRDGISNGYTLAIPQPRGYHDTCDKEAFFGWLKKLDTVENISLADPTDGSLLLALNEPQLSNRSLRSMLALLDRYGLDMSFLKSQLNSENESWFRDESAYWYTRVFGAGE